MILEKALASLALLFLLFLTVTCPCDKLLCCHMPEMLGGLAAFLGVVLWTNGGLVPCPEPPAPA